MTDNFVLKHNTDDNDKTSFVKLTHYVEIDLLKMIVNKYAKDGLDEILNNLDLNLNAIEYVCDMDTITTFWY